jgi:2-polyprenyl-3-methyl-5-hydroxy-6-metoxy-1,4-benzoquinol methylase
MLAAMSTTTPTTTTYVFDQTWQQEYARLRSLEELFDPVSERYLHAIGVRQGWRCLEVGCGAGGVAMWLADQVGPTGAVVATDLDTGFLEGRHGRANLEVRRHNLTHDPLEESAFDLVHARAVVEHVRDRDAAIARLVSALRPGGWLVLEDTDYGGAAATMAARYAIPAESAAAMERAYRAVATLVAAIGADGSYGPHLAPALIQAGLQDVAAEVHAPLVHGSQHGWAALSVDNVGSRLVEADLLSAAELEHDLQMLKDTASRYLTPFMVTAWGRRA